MAYEKTVWKNNEAPKINATNLNKMENGIANAVETDSVARVTNVVSKNLLNLYNFQSQTINGVTFTKNKDNSITINGTATSGFGVNFVKLKIKAGTYHLALNETVPNDFYIYDYDTNTVIISNNSTATLTQDYNNVGFDTWINSGTTFNNVTIYPQLEEGSSATSYTPYLNLMDAVSLIPLSFIPMNVNDTYVHSSDLDYFIVKIGKIVIMNIRTIAFKQALENDYLLASKLPAAAKDIIFYLYGGQSAKGDALRVRLNTNGDLYVHYSSIEYYTNSSNDQYGGTLIYETTD